MTFQFETFECDEALTGPKGRSESASFSQQEMENTRLTAYEHGYKSGWSDAVDAAKSDFNNVSEELARTLRDISFTYFEARSQITNAVTPLLLSILEALFRSTLSESVAANIAEEIQTAIETELNGPIKILASPHDSAVVRAILENMQNPEAEVLEEPSLTSGMAYLQVRKTETHIDVTQFVETIKASFAALNDLNEDSQKYG